MRVLAVLIIIVVLVADAYNVRMLKVPQQLQSIQKSMLTTLKQTQLQMSKPQKRSYGLSAGYKAQKSKNGGSSASPLIDIVNKATNLFPLWVLAFSLAGWCKPLLFKGLEAHVTPLLAATMLAMGITLTVSDFQRVAKTPKFVLAGFLAQFTIMPLAAAAIAKVACLQPELATGLILVGCAPGGTASNLVSLIANADVALSVLMTVCSTLAAVVLTPLLTSVLAGSYVKIKAMDLVVSTSQVVLAPVLVGLALNTKFPAACKTASAYTPLASVATVAAICGTVVAGNSKMCTLSKCVIAKLLGSVLALHAAGFGLGYLFAKSKVIGASEQQARTISIETGMQNSALAVVLAQHTPSPLLTSFPGAISATVHSLIGSSLAALWRKN